MWQFVFLGFLKKALNKTARLFYYGIFKTVKPVINYKPHPDWSRKAYPT